MAETINDLDIELGHLRSRVDALTEEAAKAAVPWYLKPSTLISALAFLLSVVSYIHTQNQDVHSLRGELRGMLQRLAALPKENVEMTLKYKSDPPALQAISSSLNQENLMLAQQAHEILHLLPTNQVEAIDYLTVGQALLMSRSYDLAIADVQKAEEGPAGLDDDVGALRTLGVLEISKGKSEEARRYFQQALDIFSKYPNFDDFTRRATTAQTELIWSAAEASIREFGMAAQHLAQAQDVTNAMPVGNAGDFWRVQVLRLQQQLQQVQTNPGGASMHPGQALTTGVAPTAETARTQ